VENNEMSFYVVCDKEGKYLESCDTLEQALDVVGDCGFVPNELEISQDAFEEEAMQFIFILSDRDLMYSR